jgi:hypothetical protein
VKVADPGGALAPRSYDGGELAAGPVPLEFGFFTEGEGAASPPETADSPPPSCEDVVALLARHCGSCHGAERPAMGLTLTSAAGLRSTAIERVARQTETGGDSGVPSSHPARFGTAMPVIEPGRAGFSYLVYKLLVGAARFEACQTAECAPFAALPGAAECAPWPDDERERLRDWFVRGEAMPPPASDAPPLDCASLRALFRFIDDGARCP